MQDDSYNNKFKMSQKKQKPQNCGCTPQLIKLKVKMISKKTAASEYQVSFKEEK